MQQFTKQGAFRRLEQKLKAVLALQTHERRRSRPQNLDPLPIVGREILRELARPANCILQLLIAHDDIRERRERRIGHHLAEMQFALKKCLVILSRGIANRVMVRVKRLDEDAARQLAAAGAPGHLRQELKRALGGAKVGRSEEHTSELQSQSNLVCRLLLEKKKNK